MEDVSYNSQFLAS